MQRKFIAGHSWLYYKIYTSYNNQERLLREIFPLVVKDLMEKNWISKFFFIRYQDSYGEHLRIRFLLTNDSCLSSVVTIIQDIFSPLLNNRYIHNIVIDSYSRELERYPNEYYEEVESLFFYNSMDILYYLSNHVEKDVLFILTYIDRVLNTISSDYLVKHNLFEELFQRLLESKAINKQSFLKNVSSFSKSLIKRLSSSQFVEDLNHEKFNCPYLDTHNSILFKLKDQIPDSVFRVLIIDLVHMMINRFFIKDQNQNEFILYYTLSKTYNMLNRRTLVS